MGGKLRGFGGPPRYGGILGGGGGGNGAPLKWGVVWELWLIILPLIIFAIIYIHNNER